MDSDSVITAIYEAVCGMHRRNRTVASAYDTPLSPLEATLLPELEAQPGVSLAELKFRLHLDQVATSRLVRGLTDRGLVTVRQSSSDGRLKEARLTVSGRKLLSVSSARAFSTFDAALKRLPERDRERFLRLLKQFNDGLGANAAASLRSDPEGMVEIRRISRVLGLLGRAMFGIQECSPLEWHVIDLLGAPNASSHVVALAELLGAGPKSIAALIQRLSESGLVHQEINNIDKRIRTVSLTPAGRALHTKRVAIARRLLAKGLTAIAAGQRSRFADLLRMYAGMEIPTGTTIVTSSLVMRRVTDPTQFAAIRAFVYEERVKQSLVVSGSSRLIDEQCVTYAAWMKDRISAIASFSPTVRAGSWRVEHLLWSSRFAGAPEAVPWLGKMLDQFAALTSCTVLIASPTEISEALRAPLRDHSSLTISPNV